MYAQWGHIYARKSPSSEERQGSCSSHLTLSQLSSSPFPYPHTLTLTSAPKIRAFFIARTIQHTFVSTSNHSSFVRVLSSQHVPFSVHSPFTKITPCWFDRGPFTRFLSTLIHKISTSVDNSTKRYACTHKPIITIHKQYYDSTNSFLNTPIKKCRPL